jgi:hypothetical protein
MEKEGAGWILGAGLRSHIAFLTGCNVSFPGEPGNTCSLPPCSCHIHLVSSRSRAQHLPQDRCSAV